MNSDAFITVMIVFVVTCLFLLASYFYRKPSGGMKWQCPPGVTNAVRRNSNGDIECYSTDGVTCSGGCSNLDCLDNSVVKPVTCGGECQGPTNGYCDPKSWCSVSDSYFKSTNYW